MSSQPGARQRKLGSESRDIDEAVFRALNIRRFVESAEDREGEIIVAAFQCISRLGISATTTRAVARSAGINLGSIHYYFDSKDALMLGVLKAVMKHKIKRFDIVRHSDLRPTQKIYYLLRSGSNFIQDREEVVATISLWAHAIAQGGVWQSTYRKLFNELRAVLKAIIDEGIETGEFINSDSTIVAETIFFGVQGISMQYVMAPSDFERESLTDRLISLFSRLLGIKRFEKPKSVRSTF
jgi:AcrR family transcriptional regulator